MSLVGEELKTCEPATPVAAKRHSGSISLSLVGLVLGLLSLGLATIPYLVMERAMLNPFETPAEAQRRLEGPPLRQGGIAFKIKGFEIKMGGKEVKNPPAPPPPVTADPLRWFTIAATSLGIIALAVSTFAHAYEGRSALTIMAMTCSVVAITWQFVVVGIVLGVALAIFVLIVILFS